MKVNANGPEDGLFLPIFNRVEWSGLGIKKKSFPLISITIQRKACSEDTWSFTTLSGSGHLGKDQSCHSACHSHLPMGLQWGTWGRSHQALREQAISTMHVTSRSPKVMSCNCLPHSRGHTGHWCLSRWTKYNGMMGDSRESKGCRRNCIIKKDTRQTM